MYISEPDSLETHFLHSHLPTGLLCSRKNSEFLGLFVSFSVCFSGSSNTRLCLFSHFNLAVMWLTFSFSALHQMWSNRSVTQRSPTPWRSWRWWRRSAWRCRSSEKTSTSSSSGSPPPSPTAPWLRWSVSPWLNQSELFQLLLGGQLKIFQIIYFWGLWKIFAGDAYRRNRIWKTNLSFNKKKPEWKINMSLKTRLNTQKWNRAKNNQDLKSSNNHQSHKSLWSTPEAVSWDAVCSVSNTANLINSCFISWSTETCVQCLNWENEPLW